jgi:hypothetical protein
MGLKGYRLWVMGQLDSNVQSPTAGRCVREEGGERVRLVEDVLALHRHRLGRGFRRGG